MIESFYRKLLVPGFESIWHRRGTFGYLRELEQSQWETKAELALKQIVSLKEMLAHAAAHCPYYRETWKEIGLDPVAVESIADLRQWPLLTREVIQQHRMQMRDEQAGHGLISKATGGSSGVPLRFDIDHESNDRRMAASHRAYGWAGAGVGTKQFYLWGSAIGPQSRFRRAKESLYHAMYRRKMVSCFGMSDEKVPWYFDQIRWFRPDAIVAYTNALYFLARGLEERGLKPFRPKSIVVGAEKLHRFQRELIERVFDTEVFETYGSREFMLIASECDEHSGLHLTMENHVVELVDDDGNPTPQGEEGNIVITDLTNYGMPFIRYLNGDRAIASRETCRCGRGLPMLREIVGRRLDTLRTPDGRLVPGEFFPHFLKDFPVIRQFQVVQHAVDDVELRVVLGGPWKANEQEMISSEIRKLLGQRVGFRVSVVDAIALTGAGKLRVVVSHCRSELPETEDPARA